jgi:ankyrin repeat protein
MKYLITTIAAVVLVGCGPSVPDDSILTAASLGDIETVKQHLAAGADVNGWPDEGGQAPPLYWAAHEGHKEIVELLIANGADVNLRSGMVVKTKDGSDGEQMAQEMMNNRTPLDMAIRKEHTEIAELLIAKGTDVNAKSNRGYTPLHEASKNEKTEILELLIANGADVNAKDDDGDTPLDYARRRKYTEVAALLRKHGGKRGKELKVEGK